MSLIISLLLCVTMMSSVTFGVTQAWYAGTLMPDGVTGTAKMGTVKIELNTTTGEITNSSDIPIILRVRVIAEEDPQPTTGVPSSDFDISVEDGNWTVATAYDGTFLVYTGGDKLLSTAPYGILMPSDTPISLPDITLNPTGGKVTLIAEALQATQKAYNYTTTASGVTSWAVS